MANTQIIVLLACVGVALVAASGYAPTGHHHRQGHVTVNDCLCTEKGNKYSPVSSDGCRSFTQATATLPAQVLKCPYGLQFDVKTCVCNYPQNTRCAYNCAAPRTYYGHGGVSHRVVSGYQQPHHQPRYQQQPYQQQPYQQQPYQQQPYQQPRYHPKGY